MRNALDHRIQPSRRTHMKRYVRRGLALGYRNKWGWLDADAIAEWAAYEARNHRASAFYNARMGHLAMRHMDPDAFLAPAALRTKENAA